MKKLLSLAIITCVVSLFSLNAENKVCKKSNNETSYSVSAVIYKGETIPSVTLPAVVITSNKSGEREIKALKNRPAFHPTTRIGIGSVTKGK